MSFELSFQEKLNRPCSICRARRGEYCSGMPESEMVHPQRGGVAIHERDLNQVNDGPQCDYDPADSKKDKVTFNLESLIYYLDKIEVLRFEGKAQIFNPGGPSNAFEVFHEMEDLLYNTKCHALRALYLTKDRLSWPPKRG